MLISTRGRYALRLMLDIAQHQEDGYLSLKTIAQRQNISLKYLESIASSLSNSGLIISTRGKTGGYRLSSEPINLCIGDILNASQGGITTVECSWGKDCSCDKGCLAMPLWINLDKLVNNYFNQLSLQDLLDSSHKEVQAHNITLLRKDI